MKTIHNLLNTAQQHHFDDFLQFISKIGFFDNSALQSLLSNSKVQTENHKLFPVVLVGIARAKNIEGKQIESLQYFQEAMDLISETDDSKFLEKDDINGFIYQQYGAFNRALSDSRSALQYFKFGKSLMTSPILKSIVNYEIDLMNIELNKQSDITILEKYREIFRKTGQVVMEIIVNARIGILYRQKKVFHIALKYYDESYKLAVRYKDIYHQAMLQNSYGFLYYQMGDHETALEHYQNSIELTRSSFQESLAHQNIALVYESRADYPTALKHWMTSFQICSKSGAIANLPEDGLRIGKIYEEQLNQPQKAGKFYKAGNNAALALAEIGIRIVGYRKQVVQKYAEYNIQHTQPKLPATSSEQFTFLRGKTWREIRDIFQYHLIIYHIKKSTTGKDLLRLPLNNSTILMARKRLTEKGYTFPDNRKKNVEFTASNLIPELETYIQSIRKLDWKSANARFETVAIDYLLREHHFNKTTLGKQLNLSYASVIAKTKEFRN